MTKLYFAYGSNLATKQMKNRCPSSIALDRSQLTNYKLCFTRYSARWGGGAATITKDVNASVEGIIYKLTLADEQKLDAFETPLYYKKEFFFADYGKVFTYIQPVRDAIAPSVLYLTKLLAGYMEYNLKISFLEKALEACNYVGDNIELLQTAARKNILLT